METRPDRSLETLPHRLAELLITCSVSGSVKGVVARTRAPGVVPTSNSSASHNGSAGLTVHGVPNLQIDREILRWSCPDRTEFIPSALSANHRRCVRGLGNGTGKTFRGQRESEQLFTNGGEHHFSLDDLPNFVKLCRCHPIP